ncbi:MAG: hypothetical protein RL701_5332 [Pseudomonadota bacterium]
MIGEREYALIFAEPHGFVLDQERNHGHIGATRDLERRAPEAMQTALRRPCAFGKNQDVKTLSDTAGGVLDHVTGVQRVGGAFEKACAVEQRPPPAAAVQHGFYSGRDVRQRGHDGRDIEKTRVICDEHHRPVGQYTGDFARVEVDQTRPAQQIVQQRESEALDPLQQTRAPTALRGVARGEALQQGKCAVPEGRDREVQQQNAEQES